MPLRSSEKGLKAFCELGLGARGSEEQQPTTELLPLLCPEAADKHRSLTDRLREAPEDERAWLDLAAFQDEYVAAMEEASGVCRTLGRAKAIREKKLQVLEQGLLKTKGSVPLHLQKIQVLLECGEEARAVKAWEELLRVHPGNSRLWLEHARFLQSETTLSGFEVAAATRGYMRALACFRDMLEGRRATRREPLEVEENIVGAAGASEPKTRDEEPRFSEANGGSSGIDVDMEAVNVPEELVQHMLGQTNGSAMEREQVAAAVRQRLMAAEALPPRTTTTAAAVQQASECAPRSTGGQPQKYKGFNDPQSPEEFLDRLETFCLVSVARDLAFQSTINVADLSGTQPGGLITAAAAPFQYPPAASPWPLHPAAMQPSYHRDQLRGLPAFTTRTPHFSAPSQPQRYQPLDPGGFTCHRCGGVGHIARECPTGRRGVPPRCYQCNGIGHIRSQCAGNRRRAGASEPKTRDEEPRFSEAKRGINSS
ncbi:hypothetical protein HPB49_020101 [Dermacentor silvarum]|uniref:Uncharacterized protein n=1 Tax=Dermacentor silvarum TaxID=543639 RepID=A0ACB8CH34_DERSI|nr:hypothetical protein HPB49_020101 [Dermacentor silvarum]